MPPEYVGNTTLAFEPEDWFERQHVHRHHNHFGFQMDCIYFERHPRLKYAIRRALTEFDWEAEQGEFPAPSLYVLVTKLAYKTHAVAGVYRGTPFWKTKSVEGLAYADVATNEEALKLRSASQGIGWMDGTARQQFRYHNARARLIHGFLTIWGGSE